MVEARQNGGDFTQQKSDLTIPYCVSWNLSKKEHYHHRQKKYSEDNYLYVNTVIGPWRGSGG
jgi:hypothetical protein